MDKSTTATEEEGVEQRGGDSRDDSKENEQEQAEANWQDADFLCFGDKTESLEVRNESSNKRPSTENENAETISKSKTKRRVIEPVKVDKQEKKSIPWMTEGSEAHVKSVPPLIRLHNEIVSFADLMAARDGEVTVRLEIVERFKKIAYRVFGKDKSEVVVFGSQSTGLFLPDADIDIVIYLAKDPENEDDQAREKREMEEFVPSGSPLDRLADALKEDWKEQLSYLEVVHNTRVPIVKFTHGPSDTSLDVCFDQEGGPQAAETMKKFLRFMSPMKPLCMVLKYFMKSRGINEPYYGGMGSYMLQLMIVSFLQNRARQEVYLRRTTKTLFCNLGSLLLEFFELYGLDFNYITTGISVRNDGSYFPKGARDKREYFWQPNRPFLLAIENPNDPVSDVGRSTFRMSNIQRAFEVAFRVLLAHVSEPYVDNISILSSIIPVSDTLHRRAATKSTFSNLNKTNNCKAGQIKRLSHSRSESSSVSNDMSTSSDEYDSSPVSKYARYETNYAASRSTYNRGGGYNNNIRNNSSTGSSSNYNRPAKRSRH